jgi:uncharacterized protein
MSRLSLLRACDYRRMRWKNGGGWTTEIARDPVGGAGDFDWRASIADIESDGPFSAFPGVSRDLLLLSGQGIELSIDGSAPLRLTERFQRARFDGESRVERRLPRGPTRDFNVMTRRDKVRADVMGRPLVDSMVLFPEPGVTWLVHLVSGVADAQSADAQVAAGAGDTLRIQFEHGDAGRAVIAGGGEIVLVKLSTATGHESDLALSIV